ncbi:hypothetical protein D3C85_700780 [compost metagenome]
MLAEQLGVDQRALALDPRQHRHQRHLDLAQDPGQARLGFELGPQALVQAQGHIGVFRRVRPGQFQGDLVEGQLLGALAGDVLEADGAVVEVFQRQAVHVVAGRRGVEHVGFEHGVEGHALHLDRRRGIGEDVDVVLGVLADLGLARVFQDRLERRQHLVAIELRRHAHIGVGQRDVGGFARRDRERQAHQLRLLRVEAGGFAVEGDQFGLLQLRQPAIELDLLEDRQVARRGRDRVDAGRLRWRRSAGGQAKQVGGRRGDAGDFAGLGSLALVLAQQFIAPALEFQLVVQLDQGRHIGGAGMQRVDFQVQRHVQLDGRQLVGQVGHVAVLAELGRQGLGPTDRQPGHLLEVGVDHVEAAAEADQQAQRGFLADPRHPRNVVDLVAHQRQVVDDQLRTDTEFLFHAIDVIDATGHGVDQGNVRADQLGHVLVAGGNHHVAALAGALAGEGADHVIGFDVVDAQQRKAQRPDAGVQRFDLHAQIIGHRRPVGLVLGEQRIAEGAALGVEHHREGAVGILLAQALEHVQHALHRTGGQALGGGQRRQGMEGAVEVRRAVDQHERSV